MPDGSQSPVLVLNQPIGMPVFFTGDYCDPNNACTDRQGSGGWKYLPAAFHVDAPGASQTNVGSSGIDLCGIGTGSGLWAGFGAGPSNQVAELGGVTPFFGFYAWYSTPGTKTWVITAYRCATAGGGETTDVLARKIVTFTIGASLFDPLVPGLVPPGSAVITSNADTLVSLGRPVVGVAADGVSLALLKIPTANVGDSITVNVLNDQNGTSSSSDEDGALGVPGEATYVSSSLTVSAVNTSAQGPYAFVVYRAPIDFARLAGGILGSYKSGTCALQSGTDDQLPCRFVSLQIQTTTFGTGQTGTVVVPVAIVRAPVVLIHGLWSDRKTWDTFAPLYSSTGGADPRFHVDRVEFGGKFAGQVLTSDPVDAPHSGLKESALGFAYNAGRIQGTVRGSIQSYKTGTNPISAPVAAIQADIIGHSMGGDITRSFALPGGGFLDWSTLYQGFVHKLVTVDTPHLGSPLATDLLLAENTCTRKVMSGFGFDSPSIRTLTLKNGSTIYGAIGDLSGDGTGGELSPALVNLQQPGAISIKTAFIVGVANDANFAGLSCVTSCPGPWIISAKCTSTVQGQVVGDPLALALNPVAWPTLFPSSGSDGVVPVISEQNGGSVGSDSVFEGYVHSPSLVGFKGLGFTGPSVMDIDPTSHVAPVALQVIKLLNTPISQSVFNSLNP